MEDKFNREIFQQEFQHQEDPPADLSGMVPGADGRKMESAWDHQGFQFWLGCTPFDLPKT